MPRLSRGDLPSRLRPMLRCRAELPAAPSHTLRPLPPGARRCPELGSPRPTSAQPPARTPRACWNRPALSGEAEGGARGGSRPTWMMRSPSRMRPSLAAMLCGSIWNTRQAPQHQADASTRVRTAAPPRPRPPLHPHWTRKQIRLGGSQTRPRVPSAGRAKPRQGSASRADTDPEPGEAAAPPSVMRGTERRLRLSPGTR